MYYLMARQLGSGGAFLDKNSHWLTAFKSGKKFPPDFEQPVYFELDSELEPPTLPTFFTSPGLIGRKEFYDLLVDAGVDNIDSYEAVIEDPQTGEKVPGYLVLNIVGLVSCASMDQSEYFELGPGMAVIDKIVIDPTSTIDGHIFRLAEDPEQMIVSEQVAKRIRASDFDDIYLEELSMAT